MKVTPFMKAAMLCGFVFLNTACSFAPIIPRVDAASVGKGTIKIETNFIPTPSLGVIYGATDDFDVGLELEQIGMLNAWGRYSFVNNPEGFSFAGNAGVFAGGSDKQSNGWYVGLLASKQVDPRIRWTIGLRYADLDYQYGYDEEHSWFNNLDFDNDTDASVNAKLDLTLSVRLKPHVELQLGGVCQYLLKNKDPDNANEYCMPTIGFSFYRL